MSVDLTTLASAGRIPLAAGVFLLPGWLVSRRLGSPSVLPTSFLASAALLFGVALALNSCGIKLDATSFGLSFAFVAGIVAWTGPGVPAVKALSPRSPPSFRHWIWFLPPAIALVTITMRAVIDPLSGYDTSFRWDRLAHLLIEQGSFAGYPAVTADDFKHYAWCDGIPPLVSLLNFWIYAFCGTTAPEFIAVRVVAETLLLGLVVYRFAGLLWGPHAGRVAAAILAASSLASWSLAIGQETGITALSLVSMLYFLELYRVHERRSDLFWAALAGGVGAAAREYGLAFPILGIALLVQRRSSPSVCVLMAAGAFGFSAPWYVRNWWITGNPLYPQSLGGWFPTNAVYQEWMGYVSEFWGLTTTRLSTYEIPLSLAVLAGVPIVAGGVGIVLREAWPVLAGVSVTMVLWLWSIPQTAGGWIYSFRTLLPALALLAIAASSIRFRVRWFTLVSLTGIILVGIDAARRSWFIPEHALSSPWSISFEEWKQNRNRLQQTAAEKTWQVLVQVAGAESIVADHPVYHAQITRLGGTATPLFSPVLNAAFDERTPSSEVVQGLRRQRVRFIVLSFRNPFTEKLAAHHRFWNELRTNFVPNATVGPLQIYDMADLAKREVTPNHENQVADR